MSQPAIEVQNLWKTFKVYRRPQDRLIEQLPWSRKKRHHELHALRDLNFSVEPGQCVGIIGSNGAGKSTMLKILTGTTFPSRGSYTVRGRVAALLELGTGFQRNATGRQNIFANAAMLGRTRKETMAKFDEILDFSELHDFIDQPVGTYSSGMVARLGFSVAVATDPDILILDEILSVGDMHFKKKCVDRILGFKERGKTMFFCSHSLYDVRQICEQTIWMKKGEMQMFDDSITVTNEYATYENQLLEKIAEEQGNLRIADAKSLAPTDLDELPRVLSAQIVDPATGQPRNTFGSFDSVAVRVHFRNGKKAEHLHMAIGFMRADGTLCFAPTTEMDGAGFDCAEGIVTLTLPNMPLLSGEFMVPVWLLDERGVHRYHEVHAAENLIVQNRTRELGLFHAERQWRVDPAVPNGLEQS